MIIIFDGERGSGKTTLIRTMLEKAALYGLPAQSIKPEAAESGLEALVNWKNIIEFASEFDGLTLIDRGLGSEWVMGTNRVPADDRHLYRSMLLTIDRKLKENFEILEFTFLVDRATQIDRGRAEWENREWDTRGGWTSWSTGVWTTVINTTRMTPDEVYEEVSQRAGDFTQKLIDKELARTEAKKLKGIAGQFAKDIGLLVQAMAKAAEYFEDDGDDGDDGDYEDREPPETFEDLLTRQQELMDILGVDELEPLSQVGAAMGLVSEAAEVTDILNVYTRPWIKPGIDRNHLVEELADVVFYVLELMLLNGVDADEFMDVYHAKWQRNIRRALEKKDDAE